jgi:hypothetical protein
VTIHQGARDRDTLGHAARKMMRIGVGKAFQAHEAHEVVYFLVLFT